MEKIICQSCGMPMSEQDFGTNKDGTKNKEYCTYCFKNGNFVDNGISMEDKIKKNIDIAVKIGMDKEKAKSLAENTIPKLKRWKNHQIENKEKDCVFCKIVRGEIPSKKTYEDDNFIGFLDIHPRAEGHTVIIPKKHFRNLLDMPSSLGNEMLEAVKKVSLELIKQGKGEGFNLIVNNEPAAGQVVFHAHMHIIPRKKNDGLRMLV